MAVQRVEVAHISLRVGLRTGRATAFDCHLENASEHAVNVEVVELNRKHGLALQRDQLLHGLRDREGHASSRTICVPSTRATATEPDESTTRASIEGRRASWLTN